VNLRDVRIVLRPRGVADVVDLSLRACMTLYRRPFAQLSAWVLLPIAVAVALLRLTLGWNWLALWLLTLLVVTPLQGVFTVAGAQLLFTGELRMGDVVRRAARRTPALVGMLVVCRVLPLLSVLGFVVVLARPYIYEVTLLESASAGRVWKRAGELVVRRSLSNLVLSALLMLAPVVAALYLHVLLVAVVEWGLLLQLPASWSALDSPIWVAGTLLATPVVACARLFGYLDARTRTEGWDVQLRFAALQQMQTKERAA
jgi:hypothetical protein